MVERLKWFDEAVLAVEAARSQPKFPGEQSPVYVILEKLVNKLWGECHDGDVLGAGGCPVCRAFRTEHAEAFAAKSAQAYKDLAVREADTRRVLESVTADRDSQAQALATTKDALAVSVQAFEDVQKELADMTRDFLEASKERGEAQAHVSRADRERDEALASAAEAQERYSSLSKALKELV
jgi:hypothetical protein